jgi:hypothetical protein
MGRYYKLIPDEGYLLWDGSQTYTEAIVKKLNGWKAVAIEEEE